MEVVQRHAPPEGVVSCHASGKVILFGEHAVVYGVPAIAAGISRGVTAWARPAARDVIEVDGVLLETEHDLFASLGEMRRFLGLGPCQLSFISELPRGAGLGSSAAMAVAAARALAQFHRVECSQRRVFDAAQCWEQTFHGTPSGVDVAAAQSGGLVRYVRGEPVVPLPLGRALHLVVIQAGPPASTKAMVDGVRRLKERNPSQFEKTLAAIGSLAENAQLLLRQGDVAAVGKLMDLNHMLLAGWMLSTEHIETACNLARSRGALGAKLTGAGGGGCVIALCEDGPAQTRLLNAFIASNMPAFGASVGVTENNDDSSGTAV